MASMRASAISIATSSGEADNGVFDISTTTTGASIKTLSGSGSTTLGAKPLTITMQLRPYPAFTGILDIDEAVANYWQAIGVQVKLEQADAAEFTAKLFASSSILLSKPPDQAILADCKEYTEGDRRFSVAQIEELGFDSFLTRRKALADALEAV